MTPFTALLPIGKLLGSSSCFIALGMHRLAIDKRPTKQTYLHKHILQLQNRIMSIVPDTIEFVTTAPLSSFRLLHSTKDTEWKSSLQKYRDEVETEHPLQIRLKRLLSSRLPSSKCQRDHNQSSTPMQEDEEVRAKEHEEQLRTLPNTDQLFDNKFIQEQSSNHRKILFDKCISKRMNHGGEQS